MTLGNSGRRGSSEWVLSLGGTERRTSFLFLNIVLFILFKDFIYFVENGREKKSERNINVQLPPSRPQLGMWPANQV